MRMTLGLSWASTDDGTAKARVPATTAPNRAARLRKREEFMAMSYGGERSETELELRQQFVGTALRGVFVLVVVQVDLELGRLGEEQVEAGRGDLALVVGQRAIRVIDVVAREQLVGLGPVVVVFRLGARAGHPLLAPGVEGGDILAARFDVRARADHAVAAFRVFVGDAEGRVVVVDVEAVAIALGLPHHGGRGAGRQVLRALVGRHAHLQLAQQAEIIDRQGEGQARQVVLAVVVVRFIRAAAVDDAEGVFDQRCAVVEAVVHVRVVVAPHDQADLPVADPEAAKELGAVDDGPQLLADLRFQAERNLLLTQRDGQARVFQPRQRGEGAVADVGVGGIELAGIRSGAGLGVGKSQAVVEVAAFRIIAIQAAAEIERGLGDVEAAVTVRRQGRAAGAAGLLLRRGAHLHAAADGGAARGQRRLRFAVALLLVLVVFQVRAQAVDIGLGGAFDLVGGIKPWCHDDRFGRGALGGVGRRRLPGLDLLLQARDQGLQFLDLLLQLLVRGAGRMGGAGKGQDAGAGQRTAYFYWVWILQTRLLSGWTIAAALGAIHSLLRSFRAKLFRGFGRVSVGFFCVCCRFASTGAADGGAAAAKPAAPPHGVTPLSPP